MRGRGRVAACAWGAAAVAVLGAFSYLIPLWAPLLSLDHHVLVLHFFDGRTRLFWLRSPTDAIQLEEGGTTPMLHIRARATKPMLSEEELGPPPPPAFDIPLRIGDRLQVPPFGGSWRRRITPMAPPPGVSAGRASLVESSFVRLPTALLVVVLLVPPIRRSIADRRVRRRRDRNECLVCGYNLTGNPSGVCPECGTAWARPREGETAGVR